jgi:hypothetical protein
VVNQEFYPISLPRLEASKGLDFEHKSERKESRIDGGEDR